MKKTKEDLKAEIKRYIQQYTKVNVDNDDRHLLCREYGIPLPNFLYVFRELDNSFNISIAKVLENRDYPVFTVNNLANAIMQDYTELFQ